MKHNIEDKDKLFMNMALMESNKALKLGEVPVGSIIVFNGNIISSAHNQPISSNNPTAHAEIEAIKIASGHTKNYRLTGSTLYVTLEPCAMCYGAIVHARISRLVFGAYDAKTGVCGSAFNLDEQAIFNHKPHIIGGILEYDCSLILKDFFRKRRN